MEWLAKNILLVNTMVELPVALVLWLVPELLFPEIAGNRLLSNMFGAALLCVSGISYMALQTKEDAVRRFAARALLVYHVFLIVAFVSAALHPDLTLVLPGASQFWRWAQVLTVMGSHGPIAYMLYLYAQGRPSPARK